MTTAIEFRCELTASCDSAEDAEKLRALLEGVMQDAEDSGTLPENADIDISVEAYA